MAKAQFVLKHCRGKRRKFTGLLLLAKLSSPAFGCGAGAKLEIFQSNAPFHFAVDFFHLFRILNARGGAAW
jgi:hypothetical protein